ncbi:hypothetical protein M426DRAFT_316020 [Hypoxylon sp. CI-4A]|nr:hypothetical protein M426DRAFT_316020 [Hypoxylon sp. CI-4A]
MSIRLEQFIKFTTDSVGLERTFRFFQSLVQILASFALPFDLLLYTLTQSTGRTPSSSNVRGILKALNGRLGLARRFFRVFRFVEFFHGAQKQYLRLSSAESWSGAPPRGTLVKLQPWLDVFARTFNGMYLLLEATTFIDALQVPGLSIWESERHASISVEAQRFWLFGLVCSAAYNLLEIPLVLAFAPLPELSPEDKRQIAPVEETAKSRDEGENEKLLSEEKLTDEEFEEFKRTRAKEIELQTQIRDQQVRSKTRRLARAAIANALDTILPASFVGWLQVKPGTVGLAMFVTTILTSMEVWEKCGREVTGTKAVLEGSFAFPPK